MHIEIIEYIRLASNFSVVIPIVFYLRGFGAFPLQHHIIGALIFSSAIADALSYLQPSPVIDNAYDCLQFALVTWFYNKLVYRKHWEFVMLFGIGLYMAFLTYNVLTSGLFANYTYLWSLGCLIIIVHAIAYSSNVSEMVIDRYFDSNFFSNLIFNSSIAVYFLVTLILALLFDMVVQFSKDMNAIKAFWSVHNVFNILKNIGFALAFYYTGKRKIYMTLSELERIAKSHEQEENN